MWSEGCGVCGGRQDSVSILTPIEDTRFHIRKVLRKALVLSLDLEGELSGVTQNQHMDLTLNRLKQM
jgi:hypothetical protein